jgi:DNA-directed RNA polymerase specialized sigma24 family protein
MDGSRPVRRPDTFDELIDGVRARLLPVLWARWGIEVGGDIASDVEAYAWEHRDRLLRMSNPMGYLYRVSQSKARRYVGWTRRVMFPSRFPDVVHDDPVLHDVLGLLAELTPEQRTCVLLVHGFGWSYEEVGELIGVRRSAVNNHVHRGLTRLRSNPSIGIDRTITPRVSGSEASENLP